MIESLTSRNKWNQNHREYYKKYYEEHKAEYKARNAEKKNKPIVRYKYVVTHPDGQIREFKRLYELADYMGYSIEWTSECLYKGKLLQNCSLQKVAI